MIASKFTINNLLTKCPIIADLKWRSFKGYTFFYAKSFLGQRYPDEIDTIPTHMRVHEKQTLYELAKLLPDGSHIVEIGSYYGASSCCWAAGIGNKDVQLHCVDTFCNDNVSDERSDVYPIFTRNTEDYASKIVVHRGLSQSVAKTFNQKLDILFIDGDHSWKGILTDLECWLPFLKEEGILVLHDVAWGDVKRALEEIILPVEVKRLTWLPNLWAGRVNQEKINLPELV